MPKKAFIEKIIESFDNTHIVLNEDEKKYADRLLFVLDLKLEKLIITDYDLYKKAKKKYPFITFPQICNDISVIERMIASEKDATGDAKKVWHRYFIVENAKKALEVAVAKGDAYTQGYLLNIIGKHNLTDKEDIIKPPFDDIIPFFPEITSDPSVLGIKPLPNLKELKEKLRKKYNLDNRITQAETVVIDENED